MPWTLRQCSRVLLSTGAHPLLAGPLGLAVSLVAQHSDWIGLIFFFFFFQQVLEVEDTSDYQCPLLSPSVQINAPRSLARFLHRLF